MRILFSSHVFAPSVGGIETVSRLLADEFARQGHEVRLITQTPGPASHDADYRVHRKPSAKLLLEAARWCDVFFHNNISLPRAWPLLLVRRPWVIAHHTWIPESGLAARLKRRALRYADGCISISNAVASHLETPSQIIPNAYDDSLFRTIAGVERTRDVVFLGRLVSDKGADLLVAALVRLASEGYRPTATIVGEGPEEAGLRAYVQSAGLSSTVTFAGSRRGPDLVQLLNQHRVLVIPSRWQEPFGVVALEGIASGCVVIGSSGGGLPDAIGACGEVFPNGNSNALASLLAGVLRDPARYTALRRGAERHLSRHSRAQVASEYLNVFARALTSSATRNRTPGYSDV